MQEVEFSKPKLKNDEVESDLYEKFSCTCVFVLPRQQAQTESVEF